MLLYNRRINDGPATGDRPVAFMPSDYVRATGKPGVVLMPGTGTSWFTAYSRSVMYSIAERLVDAGFPVVTTDAGIDQFGNDRAQAGIDAAVAFLQSDVVGCRTGAVHGTGFSQGGLQFLAWAGNGRRARALSFTGICPLTDLNLIANSPDPATRAFTNAAYPPAYVEGTHGATHNPQTMAAAGKYTNLPMTLCTSSNDAVVPPATIAAFKASVGASATLLDLGPVGHDNSVPNLPAAVAALLNRIGA